MIYQSLSSFVYFVKRFIIQTFCLISLVSLFSGCSQQEDVTILRMSHTLPVGHPVHGGIVHMAERLEELSKGQMKIKIYPGGQLGSEREQIELLQIGSLAMTKVSTSPLESFIPEMKVFSIPYVFRDEQHFWRSLESEKGKELLEVLTRVGVRGLGYYDAGARSFYSVESPVYTPDDLLGKKFRVMNSATAIEMVNTLGGAGTPIAFGELYSALDQGIVDGAENNPPSFITSGHYEVAKFYTLTEHTYVPDIVLISEYIWQKLTSQQQNWLKKAMEDSVVVQKALWATSTADSLTLAEESGVEVIYPDKAPFSSKVKSMHEGVLATPAYNYVEAFNQL